ncbi:MAG: QacE family quaternary ammonium compound efflux SMR transporter [Methylocystaceae bacterium]|nr:MAG: QacE family quaternary ammonium compound efflux SMR transporter [Methylocystaceae bacterium]
MDRIFLAIAIVSEVAATSALKASDGFSRLAPSLVVVLGYGISFFLLSMALRSIPVAIAYAVWSGVGVALIAVAGWVFYRQALSVGELAGIGLIVAGVVILEAFSSAH